MILLYLLEDDADFAYIANRLLREDKNNEYSVVHSPSIEVLQAHLKSARPDVILADLNLGATQGFDTMLMLKELINDAPIIILTGIESEKLGEKCIQLGAQDYIPKSELYPKHLGRAIRFARERFSLISSIRNKASIDELTLIKNRRGYNEEMERMMSLAKRQKSSFALLLMDLDNFKDVNDNYGHPAGDQVLEQIASRLRMYSRRSDTPCRFGGDEFALLVPDIESSEQIEAVAEEKINSIEQECYVYVNEEVHTFEMKVSVGIAVFPKDADNPAALFNKADAALYKAKEHLGSFFCFSD